jgi:uncharacterized membrane protein
MDETNQDAVVEVLREILEELRALRTEAERQREVLDRVVEALAALEGAQYG